MLCAGAIHDKERYSTKKHSCGIIMPSAVPNKVVAYARVKLLTAIHELKVAFCLAAVLLYAILRHCRTVAAKSGKTRRSTNLFL